MIKWLLCLTVIVVLGATVCVHAQSAGDYRSAVPAFVYDAEWTDVSNWEIYRTVGGWQAATGADGYPGQNASPNTVTIRQHLSIFIYRAIHINQTPNNSIQNVVVNSGGRLLTAGNPNFTISQMLTVSSGGIMTYAGTGSLTVTGATTIAGEFEDSEGSGTTRFIGLVTNSGTFTSTAVTTAARMNFRGGITNNGTFDAGAATFDASSQSLGGGSEINFASSVVVTGAAVTVTNLNTDAINLNGTAAGTLSGTGIWTQGANSTLVYRGSTITISTFNASNTGNTVDFNAGGAQTISYPSSVQYYHLTLSNSGMKSTVVPGTVTTIDVDGNLTISGTATLDVDTGNENLTIGGNWNVTSTATDPFREGTQSVTLNGSTTQSVATTVAAGETFYNLQFNNSAAAPSISMSDPIFVTGTLTMTDGAVRLNNNQFTIGSAATSPGVLSYSTNSWFYDGPLRRYVNAGSITAPAVPAVPGPAAGYFPVGRATNFGAFSFSGTVSTGGTVTVLHNDASTTSVVNFFDVSPTTVVRRNDANWVVTTNTFAAAASALAIRAEGTGFGIVGLVDDLRIVHAGNATGMGTPAANTGTVGHPVVNRSGLSGAQLASTFYIGSVNATRSPLPVELISFNAHLNNDIVNLNWRTASELNNHYFTLERASNLEKFDSLATVDGAGTTNLPRDYAHTDDAPLFGKSYYRLKQTDFDGKYTYSKVVTIDYDGPRFASLHIYPNPSEGLQVNLIVNGLQHQTSIPVQITDARGIVVYQSTFEITTPGVFRQQVQLAVPLKSGLYFVRAGQTLNLTQKLIVR